MSKTALRLVETPFYQKEVELWSEDSHKGNHSLHQLLANPHFLRPEVASHFISKYSQKGQAILDPFCGFGTAPLESLLQGRAAFGADLNPFCVRASNAKLEAADLAEVTLFLQRANLSRPIPLDIFRKVFSSFYDVDTFRELVNLREFLHIARSGREEKVARFVELVTSSILHGHNAGYLSTYTFPHISTSPEEQELMNARRGQSPDYRAVVPRILRKTAFVLRDSHGSSVRRNGHQCSLHLQDARNLSFLLTSCIDLVITTPPLPIPRNFANEQWLRLWFSGFPAKALPKYSFGSFQEWKEFMNEVLVELARVVRPGGRAILDLRELRLQDAHVQLDQEILKVAQEHLSKYWDPEGLVLQKQKIPQVKNCLKSRDESKLSVRNRVLILRRR